MNTVFVVNEPQGALTGERKIDLSPAEHYGPLIFLAPAGMPPRDIEPLVKEMTRKLSAFNQESDYLLPIGHPLLIGAAFALLGARGVEQIRTLVWVRRIGRYTVHTLRLPLDVIEQDCPHGYPQQSDCPTCARTGDR